MPLNVFTPFTLIEAEKLNENFTFLQSSLTGLTDIAVTGTVTIASSALSNGPATLRWHVCTGTTANYTVTLPAVSGNAGKYLAFRMSLALTKLVTLYGNGSEVIDGSTTRIMFAGESAVLYCDGAAWFKVAGISIPLLARLKLGTAQSIAATTAAKILLDTAEINVGGMCDTTNKRINIVRPGNYRIEGLDYFATTTGFSAITIMVAYIYTNGTMTQKRQVSQPVSNSNSQPSIPIFYSRAYVAGDYVELYAYSELSGSTPMGTGNANACSLEVMELNPW